MTTESAAASASAPTKLAGTGLEGFLADQAANPGIPLRVTVLLLAGLFIWGFCRLVLHFMPEHGRSCWRVASVGFGLAWLGASVVVLGGSLRVGGLIGMVGALTCGAGIICGQVRAFVARGKSTKAQGLTQAP